MLVVGLSIAVGAKAVPLGDVWSAWRHPDGSYASTVVASRVPRTQLGLLVGAALAVAGVVIQGLTRNPLGDPGLLGVNAGASASLVVTAAVLGGVAGRHRLGGRARCAVRRGRGVPDRVRGPTSDSRAARAGRRGRLRGADRARRGHHPGQPEVFDTYRSWVIGSLAGRPPSTVDAVLPFVVVGLVLCLLLARPLNALALGDEAATSLGLRAGRTRLLGAAGATLLCAAAVAAVGPIAFVGLAVPHVVRSFTGSDHRWLLPYCLVLGPVLLLAADVVGRVVARPGELPVGAVTAFVGAPFLIMAVRRGRVGL